MGKASVLPVKAPTMAVKAGRGKDTPGTVTGGVFSNGKKPEGPAGLSGFLCFYCWMYSVPPMFKDTGSPVLLSIKTWNFSVLSTPMAFWAVTLDCITS